MQDYILTNWTCVTGQKFECWLTMTKKQSQMHINPYTCTDTLVCCYVRLRKHKLVHLVLNVSRISSRSHREKITLRKATARLFVWEPLDELLVTRQHSRSRWDRVRNHIQSFNHILFQIYPLWTFIHSLEAFRLIKAKAVGATWAGPDLYSF